MNSAGTDGLVATSNHIFFDGVRCVPAGEIAAAHGYVRDWIARLARQGKIRGRLFGNTWYVDEQSFAAYRRSVGPAAQFPNTEHPADIENTQSSPAVFSRTNTILPPPALHDHLSKLRTRARRNALLGKTISTATFALALTAGVFALAAPDATRIASIQAQSELAAAAAAPGGFLTGVGNGAADLARSFATRVDDFIFGIAPSGATSTYRAQTGVGGNIPQNSVPTPRAATTTSPIASLPSSRTIVEQPIIQRIVEQLPTVAPAQLASAAFATQDQLNTGLSQLGNSLRQLIFQNISAPNSLPASGGYTNEIAAMQRINNLSNVTISNATVSGVSGLAASDIPALNYLPLSGGTITGTTTLSGLKFSTANCSTSGNGGKLTTDSSGNVVCAADQGGSGTTVAGSNTQVQFNNGGAFGGDTTFTFSTSTKQLEATGAVFTNATTTNATSTNFFASNASTTNATSTSLFSVLGHFTTGIIDTLSATVATITSLTPTNLIAINATTTNAISTNLAFTNAVGTNATSTNFFATTASSTNLFAQAAALGALSVASLTGPLQAVNGVVSATSSLSVAYGGTGQTSFTRGSLVYGAGSGALQSVATSSASCSSGILCSSFTVVGSVFPSISNSGLLSLAQNGGGSAQTGAITLATSSQTTNGVTTGLNITNSGATFTFAPTLSGVLTVGGGGTGLSSLGDGALIFGGVGGGATNFATLATSSGGTILQTSFSTGRPSWVATSTLNVALSDTVGTLAVNRGGTNATSFTSGAPLAYNGTSFVSTSTLAINVGGTGAGTFATNSILYGNGTGALQALAVNSTATNKFLTQSSSGAPAWNAIAAADLPGSFSGFANPSVTLGLTAKNGSATTAMRSDAAPALDQTIAPTWTGLHIFSAGASSTQLSVLGPAYFGSTATSSFSTTGALSLATALTVGNGGTGQTIFTSGAPTFYDGSKLSSVKKTYVNATCNGITDDATTINNAIANAPSGTTLILPSGTCYIGSTIQWPVGKNSITLEGGGSGATVITTDQNITMVKIGTYAYSGTDTWSFGTYGIYYIGIRYIYFQNTGSTKTSTIGVDIRGAQESQFESLTFNGIWDGIVVNPVSDWNYFDKIRGIGARNTVRVQGDGYTLNYNSTGNTYHNISGLAASTSVMQFTGCTFGDSTITDVIGTGVNSGGSGSGGGAVAAVYFNSPGTNCGDGSTRYSSRIGVSGVDIDGASDYVVRGTYVNGVDIGNYAQGGGVTMGISFDTNSANVRLGAWALSGSNLSYSSGNVGIGTTTPSKPFTVYSSGSNVSGIFGDNTAALGMGQLSSTGILQAYTNTSAVAVANLTLQPSGGKVGIGSVSPSAKLAVTGASSPGGSIFNLTTATGATTDEHLEMGIVDGSYSWIQAIKQGTAARNLVLNGGGGNVGIGTTTPYSRLTVWGPDSAASTTAFLVANNASTTEFAVLDNGNATLAGNLIQNSDQRLKTNIESLDTSSYTAAIKALNPVSYSWIDPEKSGIPQYGFIAQDVQKVFPNLVAITSPTALTPDGTLSLNYNGFIAPLVATVQGLINRVGDFANQLVTKEIIAKNITTDTIQFQTASGQRLCLGATCITEDQLKAILAGQNAAATSGGRNSATTTPNTTPPTITINGENPARIHVGDSYADLGASVTDNVDQNLGYKTFLNGTLVSDIVIDTTAVATDTIEYVATDGAGLTSTSTRTVFVQAASLTGSPPPDSTAATATIQGAITTSASLSATTTSQ